ncbi:hypothetical protein [Microbulbifer sp. CAU 1566]|nr:hypothetical protein [Microbulbifer sp. CAU 1566]
MNLHVAMTTQNGMIAGGRKRHSPTIKMPGITLMDNPGARLAK